jgi:hypothetical protein
MPVTTIRRNKMKKVIIGMMIGAMGALQMANASIVQTWSDEATFLTANSPLNLESFESATGAGTATVTAGDVTVTRSAGETINLTTSAGDVTHGSQAIATGSGAYDPGDSFFFTFNDPVNVMGLYIIGFGTTGSGSQQVTMYDGLGNAVSAISLADRLTTHTPLFFGFDSDVAITTVELKKTAGGTGDFVAFDELYYASVPEPATMGLMGVLSIGAWFIRRRFYV